MGSCLSLEVAASRNNIIGIAFLAQVYLCRGIVAYNIYYGVHIGRTILSSISLLDGGGHSGLVGGLCIHGDILGCLYIAIYIYYSGALGIIVSSGTSQIGLGCLVFLSLGCILCCLCRILGCILGFSLADGRLDSELHLVVYDGSCLCLDAAGGFNIGSLADIDLCRAL